MLLGLIAFIIIALLMNKTAMGSELIITCLILFVLFFCILNVYYVNNESTDLYTADTKKIKKRQQLSDAFDAILNKNNSSIE
ncbi:PxORF91 peptide [Plutella xylostella granulovirus]|jgi:hypothetical protein|uniref:ORF89 protein n=1 Tax=Plutella xylostella granulovirus TaxID=98383 RepID=Q9DVU2_9BBAC|nr:PxORF91 peptide [Plutella xylostella granulovirus]AAG27389.1 PxORF91 peptide [Plutella xylostella granulovirus]AMQ35701.1 PxGV-Corf89 protein [Plutella xylostella granulovirus]AMQ35818.1 PxGV-Korf89 protein [Plutella xylostella granulovirus]AMQ35935.1 PxGV-Morf89 protein [Plutella xylostella granulovirus]AMQ36052.1 PxGV-Torf89 protein [Plutella xylostella granulovirus]